MICGAVSLQFIKLMTRPRHSRRRRTQALAFEWIVDTPDLTADQHVRLVRLLGKAVGFDGMVGGQAMDIAAEGQSLAPAELAQVHARKTGALIEASVVAGAICASAPMHSKYY